jgi:DNA-binding beta-propeller fold protein YncE
MIDTSAREAYRPGHMKVPSGALALEIPGLAKPPVGTTLPEIQYTSPRSVAEAVASLGRTEDVSFSPSNRRLALAAASRNRIAVFDIDIASSRGGTQVALTGGVELSSPALLYPHGVDFIDDDTLIVTNRGSDVALFELPPGERDVPSHEVLPTVSWPAGGTTLFDVPGSVSVARVDEHVCEILICNNGGHRVTRHLLDRDAGGVIRNSEVLLRKYLDIPDGVSVSPDRRWIAVSNHNTHHVLLYENSPALTADTEPDGILRCVYYPHGLRFSGDGRYLIVADAGAPYLHIYAQDPDEWRGVRQPVATVRIMNEAVFQRGRESPANGGPKGVDIDAGSNVVVVTSECQPLAFFDLPTLLQLALAGSSVREQRSLDARYELWLLQEASKLTEIMNSFRNSRSWRITAPLRRLNSTLRRRIGQSASKRQH